MDSFLLLFTLLCFKADFCDSVLITQWPKYISSLPGSSVEMHCYQNNTDYNYKYWYRQINGEGPVLIGSYNFNSPSSEKDFESGFTMSGTETKKWTLSVEVKEGIDAVYLCAARDRNNYNPAYFGNGTKLTVLDPNIKVSVEKGINVTIIKPSEKESCKKTVTLVCVAKDFYPDHVSITWKVGNEERLEGVATDPHATQDENTKTFTISSRLKVPRREWNNDKNEFKCILKFYNGTFHLDVPNGNTVYGIAGSGYTREDYVKSSQMIKLSYGVFIAKSALYGLVIFVYVWRKGSGK